VKKCGRDGQTTDDAIIRRMRIACWLNKVTDSHPEYVILISFPRQQLLCERTLILLVYVIACIILLCHLIIKQGRQCTHNVTLRRVRATIVAVEKQGVLHNLCLHLSP
jgi:hypothetical protein